MNGHENKLRFQIVSDMHAEINFVDENSTPLYVPPKLTPLLVMAGDIYVGRRMDFEAVIRQVSEKFDVAVYVPGNHEFYNGDDARGISMERINEYMQRVCDLTPNVKMLQNETAMIGGVMFAGGTAWTNVPREMWSMTDMMRDYIAIYASRDGQLASPESFSPEMAYNLHRDFKYWLEGVLKHRSMARGDRTVVVTHHAPTDRYKGSWKRPDEFSAFYFATDMNELIAPPVNVWVHGHTHGSVDVMTPRGTRLISNPIGYAYPISELNEYYDKNLVVSV